MENMASSSLSSPGNAAGTPALSKAKSAAALTALILGAGVANMNLSVANVGLPEIGKELDASQVGLNLVAVGFSLGLSISVLYLGALGDRFGRKGMLILGLSLGIPAAFMSFFATSIEILAISRLLGGVAAGMAYPTTLALITAIWAGSRRTTAIALWSALGAGLSALSPLIAGALLMVTTWNWMFLVAVPFAVVAIVLVILNVPAKLSETNEAVDHWGGVFSAVFFGGLVLTINFVALDGHLMTVFWMALVTLLGGLAFFWRQTKARFPLFDLRFAGRPTFWVAAVSGIIVFGSLMGAMFIGQQFLQNVLDYDPLMAGSAILPCVIAMIAVAPLSSRLTNQLGSRTTLLIGFAFCLLGFASMLVLWGLTTPYVWVALSYALIGLGVGIAGTPASHALTNSVPVTKVGMASGTGDLQRDLGGAIMQSILGAILGAGYARSIAADIAAEPSAVQQQITSETAAALAKSFGSATDLASRYPGYSEPIIAAARQSFLDGANGAYLVGIIAMVGGAALVWFLFPRRDREREMYQQFGTD
jgi:MFS family permease